MDRGVLFCNLTDRGIAGKETEDGDEWLEWHVNTANYWRGKDEFVLVLAEVMTSLYRGGFSLWLLESKCLTRFWK
jgi:hypothetical protein